MAPSCGIRAHVGRAAETRDAIQRSGRAVAGQIDLQGGADEQVAGIVARRLAEWAVRTHRPVRPGEKHVGARGDVVLHAEFGTKRVDGLHETALDRGDHRGWGLSAQWLQILPFKPRLSA